MITMRALCPSIFLATATLVSACAPPPDFGDDSGGDAFSGADAGDGADDAGSDGSGSAFDEARLDRKESGKCGYPSAGSKGYGGDVGQRLKNSDAFTLITCDGTAIELSDYFCPREDDYGDFNNGILINIGAGWCGPCQDETLEFPEIYEEYHDRGIEIVQILFQDWDAQTPTKGFCTDWATGQWQAEGGGTQDVGIDLTYPIAIDQVFEWSSQYLSDPMSAAPVNLLLDANGNIRWKLEGQKPDLAVMRSQFDLVLADPYGDK